jgi:CxC2 like cysteine cluster associated with KDZ transposases
MKWYPASFDRPMTAFTFDLLDTYHKITLQGKHNLYDFYASIIQKSDNCGRKKVVVSQPVLVSSCLI